MLLIIGVYHIAVLTASDAFVFPRGAQASLEQTEQVSNSHREEGDKAENRQELDTAPDDKDFKRDVVFEHALLL
ncbi:MAG: hypothetical protein ABL996_07830 [Micropepsaceae bacterium]